MITADIEAKDVQEVIPLQLDSIIGFSGESMTVSVC